MSKMRVYEYAKKHNVQSKDIIQKLKTMNIEVSNHMSTIEDSTVTKLDESFKTKQAPKKEKQNTAPKKSTEQSGNRPNNKPEQKNQEKSGDRPNNRQGGKKQGNDFNKPNRGNNNRGNNNRGNDNRGKGPRGKGRNNRPANQNNQQAPRREPPKPKMPEKITFEGSLTVGAMAKKLHIETSEIIKKLMGLGVMATINQELDKETIELVAADYNVEVEEEIIIDETDFESTEIEEDESKLTIRPPVVTIMGHVDHGKTTLLDSIRKTKVAAGEAGGITQHIGAYQIEENNKPITFLDTPGHAAFTTMRARGAQVTDITILVVAADDGVMPQTIEAINHAKAAEVPIIVAVNKIDKEGANPDRVMQELTEHALIPEDWGGDTIFVKLSALSGEGIDDLLEMILLVAEVEEHKSNPERFANGTVIEAELDKGRGPVATLLVQGGTLEIGDPIVVGNTFGRVRAMVNDLGRRVKKAGPSTPVEITGLNDVPNAGDQFRVFKDEKKARSIGEARAKKQIEQQRKESSKLNLDDLFEQIKEGDIKEINVILKADVQGSLEALAGSLQKIDVEGVKVKIIHTGVGAIAESDIILASASNAIIIGFNVRPDNNAKRTADSEKVDIRLHRIIYNVIDEIESAMKGMLDPEFHEKVIGQVEVRTTFKVSKVGTIAGCYVTDGKVTRDAGVRLIRDGVVIYEGIVDTLKRFKDDVKEVATNYECGITLEKYNDIKEGDIIEAYVMEEVQPT